MLTLIHQENTNSKEKKKENTKSFQSLVLSQRDHTCQLREFCFYFGLIMRNCLGVIILVAHVHVARNSRIFFAFILVFYSLMWSLHFPILFYSFNKVEYCLLAYGT